MGACQQRQSDRGRRALDGEPVDGSSELIVAIRSKSPGDTIELTVRRDGSEQTYQVTLGATEG